MTSSVYLKDCDVALNIWKLTSKKNTRYISASYILSCIYFVSTAVCVQESKQTFNIFNMYFFSINFIFPLLSNNQGWQNKVCYCKSFHRSIISSKHACTVNWSNLATILTCYPPFYFYFYYFSIKSRFCPHMHYKTTTTKLFLDLVSFHM